MGGDPVHAGGTMFLGCPENALGFPQMNWAKWLGREILGLCCCCPHDSTLDKQKKMYGH